MNKTNLRQVLAALADELETQDPESFLNNPLTFIEKMPKRSLSGDHINGGKILKFSSAGITDLASKEQIVVRDDAVSIKTLKVSNIQENLTVDGTIFSEEVKTKKLSVDVLEVKEIKADIQFEKNTPIVFSGDNIYGKGMLWAGQGHTKQFVFNSGPDRFFSSEILDLAKGRHYSVNGIKVLDDSELGTSVVKSSLRELGRLKGLIVDGSVSINNYLFYNGSADRLGLGTEEPNAAFSVAEDAIEVMLGTRDSVRGIVGTYASQQFDIVTDNTARISISASGNIQLGNTKSMPVQVSVHGKLAIKVNSPDPEVDLHVNGSIKFNGRLQKYDKTYPIAGAFNAGDIVWNIEPRMNAYVGWVCLQAGSPGIWAPFGKIGS
jgi:hypothetical protein